MKGKLVFTEKNLNDLLKIRDTLKRILKKLEEIENETNNLEKRYIWINGKEKFVESPQHRC